MKRLVLIIAILIGLTGIAEGAGTLTSVYLNPVGGNDGSNGSNLSPVRSWDMALSLAANNATIYVTGGSVSITANTTINGSQYGATNIVVMPNTGYTGALFAIAGGANGTFTNITLKGTGAAQILLSVNSNGTMTIGSDMNITDGGQIALDGAANAINLTATPPLLMQYKLITSYTNATDEGRAIVNAGSVVNPIQYFDLISPALNADVDFELALDVSTIRLYELAIGGIYLDPSGGNDAYSGAKSNRPVKSITRATALWHSRNSASPGIVSDIYVLTRITLTGNTTLGNGIKLTRFPGDTDRSTMMTDYLIVYTNQTLTINDATINNSSGSIVNGIALYSASSGTLTLNDGAYLTSNNSSNIIETRAGGITTMYDGSEIVCTFTGAGSQNARSILSYSSDLTIHGGTITTSGSVIASSAGSVEINDVNITHTGTTFVIDSGSAGETVTINGGTITTSGSNALYFYQSRFIMNGGLITSTRTTSANLISTNSTASVAMYGGEIDAGVSVGISTMTQLILQGGTISSTNTDGGAIQTSRIIELDGENVTVNGLINLTDANLESFHIIITSPTVTNNYVLKVHDMAQHTAVVRSRPVIDLGLYEGNFSLYPKPGYALTSYANRGETLRNIVLYNPDGVYVNDFNGDDNNSGLTPSLPLKTLTAAAGKTSGNANRNTIYICDSTLTINNNQSVNPLTAKDTISTFMFRRSAVLVRIASGGSFVLGNTAVYHKISNAFVSSYFVVENNASITLESGASLFINASSSSGARNGINQFGGNVTLNAGALISNIPNASTAGADGVGVFQSGAAIQTANINGGAIVERLGYGIRNSAANGVTNINDNAIVQYCSRNAIVLAGGGTVNMYRAFIQNNSTSLTYQTISINNGTMNIDGAIIQNNTNITMSISGVSSVVNMTDGQIINNNGSVSGSVGFVRVINQGTFNFSGGYIGKNTPTAGATYSIFGEQVYITSGAKMNFTGGRIAGSDVDKNVICVHASGTTQATAGHLKLSDAAVIDSGYIYCESPHFAPISLNDPQSMAKKYKINLGDIMAGCVLVDGAIVPADINNFGLNPSLTTLSLSQNVNDIIVGTSAIYLNGVTGSDAFDGSTSALAVRTFSRARDRLYATNGNYIIVVGEANLSNAGEISNWDLTQKSDAVVQRGVGYTGYIVHVPSGRSLTLSDIILDGNKANVFNSGVGAIVYGASSTLTINEGTKIYNNDSYGVEYRYGKVYINGGEISNNNSNGLNLNMSARTDSLVMTGGRIVQNNIGGILNSNSNRYISITGGEISGNTGYGIFNNTSSSYYSLLKIGGTAQINNNTSNGVEFYYLDSLIMEGGQINNNGGRGIHSYYCRNVLISGSEIKNNNSSGLLLNAMTASPGNSFYLSDSEITGNGSSGLSVGTYETSSISGTTISNNGDFGINCNGGMSFSLSESAINNNSTYAISISSFENLSFKRSEIINNNGYGITTTNNNAGVQAVTIVEDMNIESNAGVGISLNGFNSYNLSENIRIVGNRNGGVYSNTSLNSKITGDLLIKGNRATNGGGIMVSSGTVQIEGNVTLEADTCISNGGGIYVTATGILNISGEIKIKDCVSSAGGGGAIYALGRLDMFGGQITGCKSSAYGTVFVTGTSSNVNLTGVKINDNTSMQGSAIFVNSGGRITLERDTIINNITTTLAGIAPTTGDIHIAGGATGRFSLRDGCHINDTIFINTKQDAIFIDEALLTSPTGAFLLRARNDGNSSSNTLVTLPGTVVVSPNGTTVADASQFLSCFTLVNHGIGRGLDKGGTEEKHIIIVNQFFIDGTKPADGDGANPFKAFNRISQLTTAILNSNYTTVWVSGPVTITGNESLPSITAPHVNIRRYTGFDVAAQSFAAYDSVMFTINEGASLTIPGGNNLTNNFTISGEGGSSLSDASIFKNNGTLTISGNTTLFYNPTNGDGSAVYQNGIFNLSGNVVFDLHSTNTVYLTEEKIINITAPLTSTSTIGVTVETSPVNTHIPGRVIATGTTTNIPAGMENRFVNELAAPRLPIGRRVNGSTADLMFYIADRNVAGIPIYASLQDAFDASVAANNDEVRLYGNTPEHVIADKTLRYNSKGHTVTGSFTLDSTSIVQLLDDLHADTLYIRATTFSKKAQIDRGTFNALITKAAYLDLRLPENSVAGDWYPINLPFKANVSDITDASDMTSSLVLLQDYAIAEFSGQRRASFGIGNTPSNPDNDWQYFSGMEMNQGAAYMVTTNGVQSLRFKASDLNVFGVTTVPMTYYTGGADVAHHGINYISQPMGINSIIAGGITGGGIIQVSESLSSDRIGALSYITKSVSPSLVIAPYTNYFYQTGMSGTVSYSKSNLASTVRSGELNVYSGEATASEVPAYYELRLHSDNPERYDALFVAASEYASKEKYEIGRDVVKMGAVGGNAMQLWSSDFDVALCANEVFMDNRQADIPLFINTPVSGNEYRLNLKNVVSWNEQLWLCRNGKLVQNLSQYPEYIIEGVGGLIDEYSLRLMTGTTGNKIVETDEIYVYTENGAIVIFGMHPEDEFMIYDASGRLFVKNRADSNHERINAGTGYYVIHINGKTYKAIVK